MAAPSVWAFFYGSFINFDVLTQVDYIPDHYEVAKLPRFDIRIQPLANLVYSDERSVYGVVATATHQQLRRLYDYAETELGGTYLPHAVLAETVTGTWRPALCYIAPSMQAAPAANDYIDRIVGPARQLGFPDWYIARLEQFRR